MTFAKLLHEFIHPLNALTSKSVIISQLFEHIHGPHNLVSLDVFSTLYHQKRTLADFQSLDLSSFKTPFKEK